MKYSKHLALLALTLLLSSRVLMGSSSNDDTTMYEVTPEDYCSFFGFFCPGKNEPWDEVFAKMFTSPECAPQRTNPLYPDNNHRLGCSIKLGAKTYRLDRPLEVARPHYIYGVGMPNGEVCPSTFSFPANTPGIIVPGWGGATRTDIGQNSSLPGVHIGEGAKMERFCLSWRGSGTSTSAHGMVISGRVVLEDLLISRPSGSGVRVETPNGGNPSLSSMHRVSIIRPGLRGFDIPYGSNSSQMVMYELNVIGPCRLAKPEDNCTSVRDASKLGNLYISPHVNSYSVIAYQFDESPTAHSLLIQAYEEDSSVRSRIKFGTVLLGTVNNDLNLKAVKLGARGFEGVVRFWSDNNSYVALGPSFPRGLLEFRTPRDAWRFVDDPGFGALKLSHGGVAPPAFRLTGAASPLGRNKFWVPSPLLVGNKQIQ